MYICALCVLGFSRNTVRNYTHNRTSKRYTVTTLEFQANYHGYVIEANPEINVVSSNVCMRFNIDTKWLAQYSYCCYMS